MRVLWMNLNVDAHARGSWDQQIVEGLVRPDAEHHVLDAATGRDPFTLAPDDEGAIVVIPGQHNRFDDQPDRLARFVADLPWALTIVTSDEEALFPIDELPRDDRHAVWGQYHERPQLDRLLPIGSGPPGRNGPWARRGSSRPLDVFFAGQVTHARRDELVAVMRPHFGVDRWELQASDGFRAGLPQRIFRRRLGLAKIAPAPAGLHSLDSFRLYEALDAGCIPVVETTTPDGPEPSFWAALLGDHPIPTVTSWVELDALVPELLGSYDVISETIRDWWARSQVELAGDLRATVERLSR